MLTSYLLLPAGQTPGQVETSTFFFPRVKFPGMARPLSSSLRGSNVWASCDQLPYFQTFPTNSEQQSMSGTFKEIINARSEHNSPINIINHPRSHHCLSRKYPSQQLDLQTSRAPQPWTAWLLSPVHPSVQPSSSADHRPWTSSFFSRQQPYLPMQAQQDASSYNS